MDDRVTAMAPVTLPCLNFTDNIHHQYRSLGGWSFALFSYWVEGLTLVMDTPEAQECIGLVDPINYLEHMQMPKLLVEAASDEFFMPDSSHFYYDTLLGPTYFWLLENSGHSMNQSPLADDYWAMLATFYLSVIESFEIPTLTWERETTETGGIITVTTSVPPVNISSWSAPSVVTRRRDFRLNAGTIPGPTDIEWRQGEVEDLGGGQYRVEFPTPTEGFFAFFIKVEFAGPRGRPIYLSSEVQILPDELPFLRCDEYDDCLSIIL